MLGILAYIAVLVSLIFGVLAASAIVNWRKFKELRRIGAQTSVIRDSMTEIEIAAAYVKTGRGSGGSMGKFRAATDDEQPSDEVDAEPRR